jgi:DNA helicase-2/ATP-dependent DNA helicase PcrA
VTPPSTLNKNHIPSVNFLAADPTALEEGMKVEHQKFGFGIIQTIEGSAHNPIANILFDLNGEKKIMLNYAKLMIINT